MILTNCAACAAPLAHNAPRCVRCWTRYCDSTCQHDHWRRGHKQMCKKIHRGGNAEQYHANKKYKEAVAVAVEACADDTKGQTCYICTQALHWKTKEGLVRGCSCRGTAGFAHVSCLVEQAKILCDEAEENNLGHKAMVKRFERWHTCSLCEQHYHSVVACALGWACWKAYVGRPEADNCRMNAMNQLGSGLFDAGLYVDASSVRETELAMCRRLGGTEEFILQLQGNLAGTYVQLGRLEEALLMQREAYSGYMKLYGEGHEHTLRSASGLASSLLHLKRYQEAKSVLRKSIPVARRFLGAHHHHSLAMTGNYAAVLYADPGATRGDLREAVATLEDLARTAQRVLGNAHPTTVQIGLSLKSSRAELRAHEAQGEAQDAFRTARLKLAQERSELAQTLASDYDEPD